MQSIKLDVCYSKKERMIDKSKISQLFPHLSDDLIDEIVSVSIFKEIPSGSMILRAGQYVKVIPIVTEGLIKVFSRHEDKDLLLYYIQPNESCIMSFSASLKNEPSRVYAITEEDTSAILLPVEKIDQWIRQFPDFNSIFFQLYNLRYSELLETISDLLFNKMDQRLYDYLKKKHQLTGKNPLKMSHRQIANDMGTAREVISRVMKRLEGEGKVRQHTSSIEII
jgi:CRP/FNR family transcriptional regulator